MTNVVSLDQHRRGVRAEAFPPPDAAALVGELAAIVERLWAASDRAAGLPYPPLVVQRTSQALLDAISATERAMNEITDESGAIPF